MAELIFNDSSLLSEIKNTRGTNEEVKALKYKVEKKDLHLKGIDKYIECIDTLNELIQSFYNMTEMDIHNLEIVRGEFLGLDADVANKTAADYVTDLFK